MMLICYRCGLDHSQWSHAEHVCARTARPITLRTWVDDVIWQAAFEAAGAGDNERKNAARRALYVQVVTQELVYR